MFTSGGDFRLGDASLELGTTPEALASELAISEREISSSASPSGHATERFGTLGKVIDEALPLCGSASSAWEWVTSSPIPSFGDLTAIELIRKDRGQAVLRYLRRLAAGGYA
jgi:uncharacterized protein (DUF2384 family)